MRAKSWRFGLIVFWSVGVAGYAIWAYGSGVQRVPVHPDIVAVFNAHRGLITVHAVGSSIALLLGPIQFLDAWRARFPRVHRIAGYSYLLVGVGLGGGAGLLLAPHAFGGLPSRLGFGLLGGLWLCTGILALLAAKRRRWDDHRTWMVRNFALTFAAITLRIYLPVSGMAGIAFEQAYPAIAWFCWVPNLILVEWTRKKPNQVQEPATATPL
jgi:hypothetical protein